MRVTPEQEAVIRDLARQSEMSVSEWVRASLLVLRVVASNPGAAAATIADVAERRPVERVVRSKTAPATRPRLQKAGS